MNDLVRFATSVELATGKKRGRHPVFSSSQFYPYAAERRLQNALRNELEDYIGAAYGAAVSNNEYFKTDSMEELALLPEVLSEDFKAEISYAAEQVARKVSSSIAEMTEMTVGKPYYPQAAKESLLKDWEANFQMLCVSAESDAKKDIARLVTKAKNEGWNGKQLEKAVKKDLPEKYANRASLIARTETAKLNTSVTLETYKEIGCQYYMWMATLDERVRPDHAMMNGLICSATDPTVWYEENPDDPMHPIEHKRDDTMVHLHPGEDFQCRCTMVMWDPVIDGKYEVKEAPEEEEPKEPEQKPESDPKSEELEKAKEETAKAEKRAENAEIKLNAEQRRREILQIANERHSKRTEIDRERIVNSKVWHDKIKEIKKEKISYNKVEKLKSKLTEKEIVERISGGDKTTGSCASVALAYVANKAGFDVLDFRGGKSCSIFATRQTRLDLFKNYLTTFSNKNGFDVARAALCAMEDGKEYYYFTGRHAAIVRKKSGVIEYLEMQHWKMDQNGFKVLDQSDGFLKSRFGCKSYSYHFGETVEQKVYLADIEKIANNEEFAKLMGYINTKMDKQKKGTAGGIK